MRLIIGEEINKFSKYENVKWLNYNLSRNICCLVCVLKNLTKTPLTLINRISYKDLYNTILEDSAIFPVIITVIRPQEIYIVGDKEEKLNIKKLIKLNKNEYEFTSSICTHNSKNYSAGLVDIDYIRGIYNFKYAEKKNYNYILENAFSSVIYNTCITGDINNLYSFTIESI